MPIPRSKGMVLEFALNVIVALLLLFKWTVRDQEPHLQKNSHLRNSDGLQKNDIQTFKESHLDSNSNSF